MAEKKDTIIDYLKWRGDITFEQSGLNVIDAIAFSSLSYISYNMVLDSGINENSFITIGDAYQKLKKLDITYYCSCITKFDLFLEFFSKLSTSKRFRDIRISYYVEKSDKINAQQFSAMTFLLPDDTAFIAFRGTDLSIHGWQEDFIMSYMEDTPGQMAAVDYVNTVASKSDKKIYIAGHSKGGNFAVWSAAHIEEQYKEKIAHVFNFDGLGFTQRFIKSKEFLEIEPKVLSFVPEESIIGVLMHHCDYIVVKSNNPSILQHDMLSWSVIGRGLDYMVNRTAAGVRMENWMARLLDGLSFKDRAALTNEFFTILKQKDIRTLEQLKDYMSRHFFHVIPKTIGTIIDINKNIKKKVSREKMKHDVKKRVSKEAKKINTSKH